MISVDTVVDRDIAVVIDIVVEVVDIVELNLPSPATAADFEGERFWNDNPAGGSMVSEIVDILGLHVFKLIPLTSSGWNFIEISDITLLEILPVIKEIRESFLLWVQLNGKTLQVIKNSLPAMASSGKGTNGPTDADDDKFEELLAGPGCCSGWQGQATNK